MAGVLTADRIIWRRN